MEEGETDFAYKILQTPEWLLPGGDVRVLQMFQDYQTGADARFIWMQADLEAAVKVDKWTASGTLGLKDTTGSFTDHLLSRRHFLMYQPNEKWAIRAGRFYPAFGVNTPDHAIAIKKSLGWDQEQESYNLEVSWISQSTDFFFTLIGGTITGTQRDKGFAIRPSISLSEKYKIGLSYYYGDNAVRNRHFLGPFFILGFTKSFFLLSEVDFLITNTKATSTTAPGYVAYARFDYEPMQGLHTYLTTDYSFPSFSAPTAISSSYGLGIQWLPRPHMELRSEFLRQTTTAHGTASLFWLMGHYYF
jgi:hypothetical protein